MISLDDIGVLSDGEGRWAARRSGDQMYVARRRNGKTEFIHRLLKADELEEKGIVDHINGNGLDNRRGNLRVVDKSTNAKNCKISAANQTGHVGVNYDKRHNVYYAGLKDKGRYIHIGCFRTAEAAGAARLAAQGNYGFTERHGRG
jgi:hypothetical protein